MDHTIEHSTTESPVAKATPASTSTDASKPELPKSGSKRKRPFPDKRKPPQNPQKRGKSEFEKSETAKHVSFTTSIFTAYEIDTSFRGIISLCEVFYQILVNRDQRIANMITANHFVYVTLLSTIYRCLLTSSKSTTHIVRNMSHLKETVHDLLLPDVLCQYIETIGYHKFVSEFTVIPYIRSYAHMRGDVPTFVDPAAILIAMERPVPDGVDWAIDDAVILEYKRAISRVLKNAVQLRCVNNSELESKAAFGAVYRRDNGRIIPLAFERMSSADCTLGAIYQFRDATRMNEWQGIRPVIVHEATAVDVNHYITDYILKHLSSGAKA